MTEPSAFEEQAKRPAAAPTGQRPSPTQVAAAEGAILGHDFGHLIGPGQPITLS